MSLTSTSPYTYEQRLAATQCIQGFIHSNPEGRERLLERLIAKYQQNSEAESNLLRHILDGSDKDPYRTWFSCVILLHLLDSSDRCKEMMRAITIGDSSSGEEVITSLQQINANLSAALINSYDPRIAVAYLMLLSIWLYEDSLSVAEFLEEGSGIQTLVGTVAQGRDGIFVTGLSAVLLGICVEFNSAASSLPPYPLLFPRPITLLGDLILTSRARLQKLITSGVGGKDQFIFRISQLRESPQFRDFKEQVTFSNHGDDELPELWFDLGFVEFVKDNYSTP